MKDTLAIQLSSLNTVISKTKSQPLQIAGNTIHVIYINLKTVDANNYFFTE